MSESNLMVNVFILTHGCVTILSASTASAYGYEKDPTFCLIVCSFFHEQGMLWANAIVTAFHPLPRVPAPNEPAVDLPNLAENVTYSILNDTVTSEGSESSSCAPLLDNTYEFVYACDMSSETAILGAVSLLLTLLNIFCIFIMGVLVLKVQTATCLSEIYSLRINIIRTHSVENRNDTCVGVNQIFFVLPNTYTCTICSVALFNVCDNGA